MAFFGVDSGTYTKADADRKRELAKQLMGSTFRAKNPLGALAMGLEGGVSGMYDKEASGAEKKGNDLVASMLQGGNWQGAMGSEWAAPEQRAIAGMLLGREWELGDRDQAWAREDALRAADAAKADWQTFEQGGDIYRWNETDPNSRPEVFFDGPNAPPEAPRIEEAFDPVTGRPIKKQWAGEGGWQDFGGVAAPKDPLVNVDVNNGGADEDFYKAGAKARGETFAGIEAAGIQAATKIGQINRLEQLLQTAPQGFVGGLKQAAGEFGIATEGLNDIQAAQALINKMVPEQRTPGSGPMSDADLALFKQSLPRIINQPGGNDLVMQTLKGIAVYEQQTGEIASKVLNREMTPAEGRAAMAAVQNPLELFRSGGSAAPSSAAPEGIDPEDWAVMTPEQRALWN